MIRIKGGKLPGWAVSKWRRGYLTEYDMARLRHRWTNYDDVLEDDDPERDRKHREANDLIRDWLAMQSAYGVGR
jgi:hypothetical protein